MSDDSIAVEAVVGELVDNLESHWTDLLRPKVDGVTDDEYLWEPVDGCWSVRPIAEASAPPADYASEHVADFAWPEPDPAPVTTIAWRMVHLTVGVFGMRNAAHFGGPPIDYTTHTYAADAATGLDQLDEGYQRWVAGVRSLGDRITQPVGQAEGCTPRAHSWPWYCTSIAK